MKNIYRYYLSSKIHGNTSNAMKKMNCYARQLIKALSMWFDIITTRLFKYIAQMTIYKEMFVEDWILLQL